MSERGVCICPSCGCQFSDDKKVRLERQVAQHRKALRVLLALNRARRTLRRLTQGTGYARDEA